jgi:nucleotide-binding universal stress UspA family protein
MRTFQHIIVPVDFGDAMKPAIEVAVSLARKFDARITLMTAFDVMPFVEVSRVAPPLDIEPLVAGAQRELDSVLSTLKAEWPNSSAVLRRGTPCDAILEAAKTAGGDLIVIGTHGRHGVARMLLGSVAERVVRLSAIPVLTVHAEPRAPKP